MVVQNEQFGNRFPMFKDEELIKKFLAIPMTNNQKCRMRQTLKDSLKGTSDELMPDAIYSWIQTIVKEKTSLTVQELKKIRILYNMLKTAAEAKTTDKNKNKKSDVNKKRTDEMDNLIEMKEANKDEEITDTNVTDEENEGVKKHLNLPLEVGKEQVVQNSSVDQFGERFAILKNEELIKKFLATPMTNNQKGRMRQTLKDSFKGTSDELLPDVIYSRIQTIVKDTASLTDPELRKIRILYNMLKTAVETKATEVKNKKAKNKKKKHNDKSETETEVKEEITDEIENFNVIKKEENKIDEEITDTKVAVVKNEGDDKHLKIEKDRKQDKIKGPKRYVVFVGNLPLDVDKEQIMKHFNQIKDNIVDVRIPKTKEGQKSSIAYVELKNELCYELALSKHHSMFGNKRLNVLYTTQKGSKISKAEAKGKAAKLVALQKSGKLAGSIPLNRKRSQRRMKAKKARAKLEAEA
ncbi:uncharacterized protein LOC112051683 isoform X2 [Bicyclus anynana]|uniref:Uncharacterized protein LOC112051683 isoform X2 n=1 Tax=Bicyclus anynana TaxID=110368 RepID=A0ABM3LVB4_BICAN|nr:uncharacterized protein LOC112051683 isoform X2 [Bicyclus anynana]